MSSILGSGAEPHDEAVIGMIVFVVVVLAGLLILDVVVELYRWNIRRREERDRERPWRGIG